jgi:hypothetical protein
MYFRIKLKVKLSVLDFWLSDDDVYLCFVLSCRDDHICDVKNKKSLVMSSDGF